nr:hypothetical protein S18_873_0002 [uncultured Flavobacteriia bacterium]
MSELTHINCVALTARFPVGKPVVPAALMNRPTRTPCGRPGRRPILMFDSLSSNFCHSSAYYHLFRRSNQAFKGTNNCLKKITPRPATHRSTVVIH